MVVTLCGISVLPGAGWLDDAFAIVKVPVQEPRESQHVGATGASDRLGA